MAVRGARDAGARPAHPQDHADLDTWNASSPPSTIKAIMAAEPTKAAQCEPLLEKLKAQRPPAA